MKKACSLLLVLLCACSTREDTSVTPVSMTPEDMLAKIRASGEVQNEVMFQTMPDDAVLDLREQARQAQSLGEFEQARNLLGQALAIDARDPEAMQMLAELAILQKSWAAAERMALQSFASGPKLGGLCRRNWLTVHYARLARGQPMADHLLAKSLSECTIVPPARM
jgi:lipoprotein NlpI